MDVERLDLGDGQWWEMRPTLTRGMEKAITKATIASIPAIKDDETLDANAIKARLYSHLAMVNVGEIEDVYLVMGTVAFSVGPPALRIELAPGGRVDLALIDTLDASLVRVVLNRMYALYTAQRITEDQRDGFFANR